ncbi:MAG: hypothetical protein IT318_26885 [Anaerolineales bacterium]|nr:hypothetical protein [Anaerolineales bacterium]
MPVLVLAAISPMLASGLPPGHDLFNHLMRLAAFDQAVRSGQWYPRWLPDLALGFGYPLYNFYAPGSAYLAEVFRLVGLSYPSAFIGLFAMLLLAAALGMWRLAADFFPAVSPGQRGSLALVAAAAYLYAPYVLTNVYMRGATAELGAQALLPWALWSVRRLLRDDCPARWVLPAAASVAGLAVMHNLSLLLAIPLLVALAGIQLWQAPRRAWRLAWAGGAAAAAVGLSAFYWWPLLGERPFLADTFAQVARQWLPTNLWTWPSFLDASLVYRYSQQSPFPLGLAQVGLALAGLWLARRWWNAEWLLLALTALGACALIGQPWREAWLNSPLLILQFPWRLLGLVDVVLALFTAGSLLAVREARRRALLAGLLLATTVAAHQPRAAALGTRLPADLPALGTANVAQFERQTNSLGATTNFLGVTSDFMPRWVDQTYGLSSTPQPDEHLRAQDITVAVRAASAMALELSVNAPAPVRVRLSTFYFPGWQATLDGQQTLPVADTPLGLLTIDVPAGAHVLAVRWAGTPLQRASSLVSAVSLAGLAAFALRRSRARAAASALGVLGLLGALTWLSMRQARPAPVHQVEKPFNADGIELVGYVYHLENERTLVLRPYWLVRQPAPDVEMHWRLRDGAGGLAAEARARPFFDTLATSSWRRGTLVDDGYTLGLPDGLPAGDYALELCAAPAAEVCAPQRVGLVRLQRAVPAQRVVAQTALDARFGEDIFLAAYDLRAADGRALPQTGAGLSLASAGQALRLTLYWRALRPPPANYHGFVHLADAAFNIAAQQDDTLGPAYLPPRLWGVNTWQPDSFELRLPAAAPSSVYWPLVGVYDFASLERLPVKLAGADAASDSLRLPPVKVLNAPRATPQHASPASFEGLATLLGYDLALPAGGLRAGSILSVTLYFRAEQASPRDLTRFIHLGHETHGLAAQADGPPQDGRNPTWAWVPGEVIADTVVLTIAPQAPAGQYELRLGLYDPAAGGARLPVYDQQGQPLPDDQVVLTKVTVAP